MKRRPVGPGVRDLDSAKLLKFASGYPARSGAGSCGRRAFPEAREVGSDMDGLPRSLKAEWTRGILREGPKHAHKCMTAVAFAEAMLPGSSECIV